MKLMNNSNLKVQKIKSVRVKLFLSLCVTIIVTIFFLIIINSIVLENFYIYNKKEEVKEIYEQLNSKYNEKLQSEEIEVYIKEESSKNNLDILIKDIEKNDLIINNKTKLESMEKMKSIIDFNDNSKWGDTLYQSDNAIIRIVKENSTQINYIVMMAKLDNGNELYIRTPVSAIKDSLKVSNQVLILVGLISILISAIIASIVSRRFSEPILELNSIAKKMLKLDFSQKYMPNGSDDELDELGNSINLMSDKLEHTINELRENNDELERDIKEKSKIDEMRTQFISDVSHELKTPIALIQGYAEGLIENVNTDEESRKFYSEVILDEANKMDKLVKQLLDLLRLEYGKREFNNKVFDIVALIKEVLRNCDVMIKEQNIKLEFECNEINEVFADDFYIEQVVTNYITNAIKYSEEINGKRLIKINVIPKDDGFIRVSVYNTCKHLSEQDMKSIWGRFYKIDTSRNRENGGTGIGLALVKAVMNNYQNRYGVQNSEDGVEFYFELEKKQLT